MSDTAHKDLLEENERLREQLRDREQAAEDRDRLREALRLSQEQVRLFVTYTPAAVAMLDREMRYILASRRWLIEYRLEDQPIIGRSHYELFPEIPERWREIHRRCLAGASEGCDEDPFPRGDGSVDWVRWKIYPWHTEGGEIGGIIMFTEVITERKRMEDALRAQAAALEELSTPIVPISDDVIVAPIIGALDTSRAQQMMEHLLAKVVERGARIAIVDVTGVPHIDTRSAGALVRMAQAVRLLGARVVLTGIRPEVSQAIVGLDIDLAGITTLRDLQSGIAFARKA
jgi:rsbT co-antagonist protein RsbR